MIKMKNILIILTAFAVTIGFAAPHYPTMHISHRAPVVHRRPASKPISHHHSHSVWGRGGNNFWPGFFGGMVGSLVTQPIPPPPPRPVVFVQQTWVPPVYETRPVYDAYGRIIRYEQVIIVPGYWK